MFLLFLNFYFFSEIVLCIVESDAVRPTKKSEGKVWCLIGCDGYDYITVTFWDKAVDRIQHDLGNDLLVGLLYLINFNIFKGKTFVLRNFSSSKVNEEYNLGSVPLQLIAKEGSTVVPMKKNGILSLDVKQYYEFLKMKHALDESSFDPIPLSDIRIGETIM